MTVSSQRLAITCALVLASASSLRAQNPAQNPAPAPTPIPSSGPLPRNAAREQDLLRQTKAPDGFTVTVFAGAPVAEYPTCLANSPDGALFVCVDPNLSLSVHKGIGRIVRLVDDDRDGRADRYTVFAQMDSPRGAFFDGSTLYVMHPPFLTAYRDTNGDGIADESDDLVKGLGFDLDFRGADHTTNQITMGIDGWIYVAVGDYGYQKAVGKDGATIGNRGGSVVRVRPDGTGLEIYAVGTRNIYDVALDPFLHVFTRDNTNDGDGWDTRLHYIPALAHMGYPMYYKNFAGDHMPSLHDYGAGAGTGAVWVHDPGFPAGYDNVLYTGDWTMNKVFRNATTSKGASFDVQQDQFLSIPRPSDMVMDANSNMYVATLIGGTFTYVGDTVGGVVRVSYPATSGAAAPLLSALGNSELMDALVGPYAERRLQAQRELLRRARPGRLRAWWTRRSIVGRLSELTLDARRPDYARVAAMFTLKQIAGVSSHDVLLRVADDPAMRALALHALADDTRQLAGVSTSVFVRALSDRDPRVQLQAIEGLVRLGAHDAAASIVPLTGSADAAIAHVAVKALVALDAGAAALAVLDTATPDVRRGALRVLEQMHNGASVSGLIARFRTTNDASARRDVLAALARLYNREAAWKGEWWTTRPSFLGPYFAPTPWEESATIRPVLRDALLAANGADLETLATELARNRVLPQGAKSIVIALAAPNDQSRAEVIDALVGTSHLETAAIAMLPSLDKRSPVLHSAVAQLLAGETSVGEQLLPLVRTGALDSTLDAEIRGRLLNSVAQMSDSSARATSTELFVRTVPGPATPAPVEAAWRRYVGDRRRGAELDQWVRLAQTGDPAQRTLAFSVLAQGIRGQRVPPAIRNRVVPVIDAAWFDAAATPSLVQAIRVMKLESQYANHLTAYDQALVAQENARKGIVVVNALKAHPKEWIQLWNGRDLQNWDIKFKGRPVNENYNDTFRAESGLLKVRYDKWNGFKGEFGHIFTRRPFSNYIVAAEYRFVGNQVAGAGPQYAWALRNNGIMIQSQSAASMGIDQDFPISLEVQLLGGLGTGPRSTANLCTPGTNVHFGDSLITQHCINSISRTYDGDQWVRVEALVLGDSIIKHIVNGDTVMTYRKPEMGGGSANNTAPGVLVPGKPLTEGYITLQAETAEIDFRKVELLELKGCMNPKAKEYRRHFIVSDPSACSSAAGEQTKAVAETAPSPGAAAPRSDAEGRRVYSTTCVACHQVSALGLPPQYPPLAGSEWVTGDERRLLRLILHGLVGEVSVAGETFNGAMPGWGPMLKDAEIAAVATYIRGNFGNKAAPVSAAAVARVRKDFATRTTPWTAAELTRP